MISWLHVKQVRFFRLFSANRCSGQLIPAKIWLFAWVLAGRGRDVERPHPLFLAGLSTPSKNI